MKYLGARLAVAALAIVISSCHGDLGSGNTATAASVAVPAVVGVTQSAANTDIVFGAGLKIGTVTLQTSSTIASGVVLTQSPAAGTVVASGSAVNLTVSSGPAEYVYIANQGLDANNLGTLSAYTINGTSGALTQISSSPIEVPGSAELYEAKIDPSGHYLYVVDFTSNVVFAFVISAADHSLSAVSNSPFATGQGPVSLAFDSTGSYVYVSNYTDGTISAYTLDATSGALTALVNSPYTIRGTKPNPRQLVTAGNYLYVADHGLNSIEVFSIAAGTGQLTEGVNGLPYATDTGPYAIVVDPSGAVLYSANAGTNSAGSISAYTVNSSSGELTPLTANPLAIPVQGFLSIDPQGKYLLVTETNGVAVYPLNLSTAVLGAVVSGSPFTSGGSNPFAVSVAPSEQFVYVSNNGSADVAEYRFDSSTGVMTTATGSPLATGTDPGSIAID